MQIINNSTPVRFHTLKLYFLFTHLLSFLSSAICIAQEDSTIVLTDVVVSGTRFESLLNESPQEIEIIDKKQIAFQNTGNSAVLLEQSGEVFVQKSQAGGGSPVVRGFEANKVLIVVDGVRMNNAIFRGGHLQNVLRIDQNILERVEIVMGPSSVQYGSDALGGVMHFRTKEAQFEVFNAKAFIRHGTVNHENTLHVDLNAGFKDLAFLSSFTASRFRNLRMGENFKKGYEGFGLRNNYLAYESVRDLLIVNSDPFVQTPSGYSQFDFLQKMKFNTGKLIHRLNFQASISSSVPRYDRLTDRSPSGDLRFAEWKYGPEARLMGSYNLELPKSKLYDKANITGSLQFFNESRITRRAFNYSRTTQAEKVSMASINADFQKNIEKHTVQYGVELVKNEVNSRANTWVDIRSQSSIGNIQAQTRYPDGGSETNSYSVYVSDHYKLNPKLLLNGGIRFNYSDLNAVFENKDFFPFEGNNAKQKNTAFSGNMGLIIFPTDKTRIKTLISSGFRTPNVDDLAKVFDSAAGTLIVPNPNLGPEYSYNAEIGFTQDILPNLSIEALYFQTFLRNAIAINDFSLNGSNTLLVQGVESRIVAMQNQSKATIHGWNAKLNYKITTELNLSSTLSKTIGRLDDGTPLDHIPPLFGKTSLIFKRKNLELEVYSMYNGWKRIEDYSPNGEDNIQYATADGSPSWWTGNFRSGLTLNHNWTLQFSVENIFDRNYRNFASGISAAGRNFLFTIRKEF